MGIEEKKREPALEQPADHSSAPFSLLNSYLARSIFYHPMFLVRVKLSPNARVIEVFAFLNDAEEDIYSFSGGR